MTKNRLTPTSIRTHKPSLVRAATLSSVFCRRRGDTLPNSSSTRPVRMMRWFTYVWKLLKRVFALDLERCPGCQQGRLRIIAALTEVSVIKKILRHLKLAVDPPPIAPAQQAAFSWDF